MPAGGSATEHARLRRQQALEHERLAGEARAEAARFEVAADTERRIIGQLGRLSAEGFHLLADRAWPGSHTANVDAVVVGPSGVFIVDPKCWADVALGPDGLTRAGEPVDFSALRDLGETTRAALADIGLPPREVHVVVVFAGWRDLSTTVDGVQVVGERLLLSRIVSGGERLTCDQVDVVLARCLSLFRPMARRVAPVVPVQPAGELSEPALLSEDELADAVLEGALRTPIEEWMSFLHPEQARLVRRVTSGPSRVRGAAGTGKSVVGLHRAAWLAQTRPGRVLVTSFVRTVPNVLRELLLRLAPEVAERVDCLSVHALAFDLLRQAGVRATVEQHAVELEFQRAWSRVGVTGALAKSPLSRDYWREELQHVIRGRGLQEFAQYEGLARVGRRYPVSTEQRAAVWDLYLTYQAGLAERGLMDYQDVLIAAERQARSHPPGSRYGHVIVDEVQDLTCVGIRLLHALVGDAPEGLMLIGDGQQAIYPGGFTLSESGVDVRGRATVLRRNYRNTAEILRTAQDVVAGDTFADLDDLEELAERDVEAIRHGPQPVRVVARDRRHLDLEVVAAIERVRAMPGVQLGDIAVLLATNNDAHHYRRLLGEHEVPVMDLADYHGRPSAAVKVGTYHRAKGLDFKHVLLPLWNARLAGQADGETDATHRERVERDRRTLFVAITRARDGLWLGSIRR